MDYLLLLVPYGSSQQAQRSILFLFAAIFGAVDYSVVPVVVSLVRSVLGDKMVGLGVGILLLWHSLGLFFYVFILDFP